VHKLSSSSPERQGFHRHRCLENRAFAPELLPLAYFSSTSSRAEATLTTCLQDCLRGHSGAAKLTGQIERRSRIRVWLFASCFLVQAITIFSSSSFLASVDPFPPLLSLGFPAFLTLHFFNHISSNCFLRTFPRCDPIHPLNNLWVILLERDQSEGVRVSTDPRERSDISLINENDLSTLRTRYRRGSRGQ